MPDASYRAVILDLDGVITKTARLHAQAWKQLFDAYLGQRSEPDNQQPPFDSDADYRTYIDGKPRYDGVRSFLASRGITVPEGTPDDPPGKETICGLGNRKNEIFLELLRNEGVETYADAVEQIRRWRAQGVKTAVVTSSRNGETILEAAGLQHLFDAKVDGVDAERLGLRGKPAPDIFLQAARALAVEPRLALVVEDAIAGVEAGRAGGFGKVAGVARDGDADTLRKHGADVVVPDLRALDPLTPVEAAPIKSVPSAALDHLEQIVHRLDSCHLALFTDYDGTLTPIVRRPEEATLSANMRSLLQELAARSTVAVISGRDLADVQHMVGLDTLYYAGSHGFDIAGPGGLRRQQEDARACLADLNHAETQLRRRLRPIEGARVERKRFAIAVHYREAAERDVARIEDQVDEVLRAHRPLRKRGGKKIFELQPDVPWDKGRAVCWLLDQLDLNEPTVLPIYLGDDVTDEDAFEALAGHGIGIRIGPPDEQTHADYFLQDTEALQSFFRTLLRQLDQKTQRHG